MPRQILKKENNTKKRASYFFSIFPSAQKEEKRMKINPSFPPIPFLRFLQKENEGEKEKESGIDLSRRENEFLIFVLLFLLKKELGRKYSIDMIMDSRIGM